MIEIDDNSNSDSSRILWLVTLLLIRSVTTKKKKYIYIYIYIEKENSLLSLKHRIYHRRIFLVIRYTLLVQFAVLLILSSLLFSIFLSDSDSCFLRSSVFIFGSECGVPLRFSPPKSSFGSALFIGASSLDMSGPLDRFARPCEWLFPVFCFYGF